MAGEFVPLADFLRAPAASAADATVPELIASAAETPADRVEPEVRDVLRDARLFRARLADAVDEAAARLLRELASDVLARELRLAPCDVAAIVRRIAERAPAVRVRVATGDLACGVPLAHGCDVVIVEDPALAHGDAVVELGGGALDARLGVRLAIVLETFA